MLQALDPFLSSVPGAFVFGSNDYKGPVWRNPLRYVLPIDDEYVQGVDLPFEELRAAFVNAGWADLNNARTVLKAGGRSDIQVRARPARAIQSGHGSAPQVRDIRIEALQQ